jgi:rhamnose utilization protein RhaD (predicted bifunctional aldolase and dehydrogenase)
MSNQELPPALPNPDEWGAFLRMSADIGNDIMLVQGAGGNISLKVNGVLWIKASGKWLSDALSEDIFVPLALDCARNRALLSSEDYASCAYAGASLRPSIETGMHASLPHRVVIHVHSINVLTRAVLKEGEKDIQLALGDIEWRWIPYARPGAPLTSEILSRIDKDSNQAIVLILANHGIVVAADTVEDALSLLYQIESMLRIDESTTAYDTSHPSLKAIAHSIHAKQPKDPAVAQLALNSSAVKVARKGPLYPDHAVFLGPYSLVKKAEEMTTFDWNSHGAPYIIIEQVGVLVNEQITENAEAMLSCWARLAVRISEADRIAPLPESAILELTGWDAEKYRQSLVRIQH